MRAQYCINCGKLLYNRPRCISCGTEAAEYVFEFPDVKPAVIKSASVPAKEIEETEPTTVIPDRKETVPETEMTEKPQVIESPVTEPKDELLDREPAVLTEENEAETTTDIRTDTFILSGADNDEEVITDSSTEAETERQEISYKGIEEPSDKTSEITETQTNHEQVHDTFILPVSEEESEKPVEFTQKIEQISDELPEEEAQTAFKGETVLLTVNDEDEHKTDSYASIDEKESETDKEAEYALCPSCGNQLPANARFCMYCGYDLSGKPKPALLLPAEEVIEATAEIQDETSEIESVHEIQEPAFDSFETEQIELQKIAPAEENKETVEPASEENVDHNTPVIQPVQAVQENENTVCRNCGMEFPSRYPRCPYCGTPAVKEATVTVPELPETAASEPEPVKAIDEAAASVVLATEQKEQPVRQIEQAPEEIQQLTCPRCNTLLTGTNFCPVCGYDLRVNEKKPEIQLVMNESETVLITDESVSVKPAQIKPDECVCTKCGRVILKSYEACPYCGAFQTMKHSAPIDQPVIKEDGDAVGIDSGYPPKDMSRLTIPSIILIVLLLLYFFIL